MLLRVDCSSEGDFARIVADGEIDLAAVNKLRSAVTELVRQGTRHLTVDLDNVTYIDSSGLGMLIGAHKRMASSGGTLTIRCAQARVLRLLSITGLDRVLRVTTHAGNLEPDLDEAVEATPA